MTDPSPSPYRPGAADAPRPTLRLSAADLAERVGLPSRWEATLLDHALAEQAD